MKKTSIVLWSICLYFALPQSSLLAQEAQHPLFPDVEKLCYDLLPPKTPEELKAFQTCLKKRKIERKKRHKERISQKSVEGDQRFRGGTGRHCVRDIHGQVKTPPGYKGPIPCWTN